MLQELIVLELIGRYVVDMPCALWVEIELLKVAPLAVVE
jgi:hypothetical protein